MKKIIIATILLVSLKSFSQSQITYIYGRAYTDAVHVIGDTLEIKDIKNLKWIRIGNELYEIKMNVLIQKYNPYINYNNRLHIIGTDIDSITSSGTIIYPITDIYRKQ